MKKNTLLKLSFIAVVFFSNQVFAQDASTVFTKDGVKLEVRATPNNTLVELFKEDSIFTYNIASASFPATKRLAGIIIRVDKF